MSRFRLRTAFVAMFVLSVGLAIAGRYWRAWQHEELGNLQLRILARTCPTHHLGDNRASAFSWRVHLLPAVGERALYEKFRLDESWDSPHNAALIAEMPAIYRVPGSRAPVGWTATFLVGLNDQDEFGDFEGPWLPYLFQTTDELAVPWTKPDETWNEQTNAQRHPQPTRVLRALVLRSGE